MKHKAAIFGPTVLWTFNKGIVEGTDIRPASVLLDDGTVLSVFYSHKPYLHSGVSFNLPYLIHGKGKHRQFLKQIQE